MAHFLGIQVHSDVRKKWLLGDKRIRELMADVAQVAEKGRASLLDRDYVSLATLMDRNFDLRRYLSNTFDPKMLWSLQFFILI